MRKIIFLLLVFNNYYFCLAQYSQPFQDIKSPEVSLFERYGNQEISKYHGTPNISVPLYTINHGDISIPLQITYNTNGIRVDEEASQFGLGWYFGTGMISQIKNGKNDLIQNIFVEQPDYYTGTMSYIIDPISGAIIKSPTNPNNSLNQYYVGRIRTNGEVTDRSDCLNILNQDGRFYYPKNNIAKNYSNVINSPHYEDFEIDYFKATFFGHEITFYINPRNSATAPYTFSVINKEKYKIQLVNTNWIITDPSGIEYYFEEKKNAKASSSSYYQLNLLNSTSSDVSLSAASSFPSVDFVNNSSAIWKITKIKDTKGNEVLFNYDQLLDSRFSSSSNTYEIKNLNISNNYTGNLDNSSQYFGPMGTPTYSSVNDPINYTSGVEDYTLINSHTVYQKNSILSNIIFGDSRVEFNNTDRLDSPYDKKTENISVFYKTQLIKSINLSYDYFNNSSTDNLQKRLKLINLIHDNNQPYKFVYNLVDTPNKNTLSFDYWGFYNGMPNTTIISNPFRLFEDVSQIPLWAKPYISILNGICNRSAHPEFCKAGMLEQITYPTGGYTRIEYELNEFDNYYFPNYDNKISPDLENNFTVNYIQSTSKGFGLRVKSIKDYSSLNSYISKQFIYKGGKHINPYLGYRVNTVSYQNPGVGSLSGSYYPVKTTSGANISSYSTLLFQNNLLGNGNSIGYDSVDVIEFSAEGNQKGKITSYFTNIPDLSPIEKFDNGYSASIGFNPEYFDSFGSSIRNSDIDNGLLTREETFDNDNNLILEKNIGYSSIMPINTIKFNLKLIPIQSYFKTLLVDCLVNCDNPSCRLIKTFNYSEYLLFYFPLKLSNTKIISEKVIEYFPSGSKWTSTSYQYNSNDIPTGKKIRDQYGNYFYEESSEIASSSDLINRNILNLPASTRIIENGSIKKQYNYLYSLINNNILLSKTEELPEGNPNPSKKINIFYDLYDDKNNLLQYHKENDIYTSIIWGYNKTLPVAKIENAQYNVIQPSLITAIQNASNTGTESQVIDALNNLRSSLPNAYVTSYVHKPLIGVSCIIDAKGDKITYHYDLNNRLQFIKDKNGNILSENEYHFRTQN